VCAFAPFAPSAQRGRRGGAAGVSLFELARFMGTSVEQIDETYGHLLPDARERTKAALDVFIARAEQEATNAT
jgi:hypothetical protein